MLRYGGISGKFGLMDWKLVKNHQKKKKKSVTHQQSMNSVPARRVSGEKLS